MQHSDISAMEKNFREKLKYVVSKVNAANAIELKGVSIVDSTLPTDTFNTAYGGLINEELAKEVFAYYKNKSLPMAWWIGPSSTVHNPNTHLEKAGFVQQEIDVGMVCDLTQVEENAGFPEGISIQRCTSAKHYADFGDVLASIFNPEDIHVKQFYKNMAKIDPKKIKDMVLFVGYENEVPVATSCLLLTDVAGIYDIATRPDKRKKGYGAALFYQTLLHSKALGYKKGVLQASPDGLNIYKRFGFKEVCHFEVWGIS